MLRSSAPRVTAVRPPCTIHGLCMCVSGKACSVHEAETALIFSYQEVLSRTVKATLINGLRGESTETLPSRNGASSVSRFGNVGALD